jgi:anti-anti-sigma regulatory factor
MFHAELDNAGRVLTMSFADRVDVTEMKTCLEKVRIMVANINPGFRLLTDLTSLEHMDADCATDLGEMMSLCDVKGISAVMTVVPDPKKDIGFFILEPFHYRKEVEQTTHETLADAIQSLAASISDEGSNPQLLKTV